MEALLLVLDALAFAAMAFMGVVDTRRRPGESATSLFRLRDPVAAVAPQSGRSRRGAGARP